MEIYLKILAKKGSILFGISNLIFIATLFLFDIYIARNYTLIELAQWKQVLLLVQLLIPVFSFGLIEGYRFAISSDKNSIPIINTAILIGTASITIIMIIFFNTIIIKNEYTIALNIDTIKSSYHLIPYLFFCISINKVLQYLIINYEKVVLIFNSYVIWSLSLLVLFIFFKYYTRCTLEKNVIYSLILSSIIQSIYLKVNINFGLEYKNIEKYIIKLFSFGIPLSLVTYMGLLTLHVDKTIVNIIGGSEVFAVYSVGALEIPYNAIIVKSITTVSYPKIVNLVKNNYDLAIETWLKDLTLITYLTFPVIVILILFAGDIINFLFGPQYKEAAPILRAYSLILIWRNSIYGTLSSAKGETITLAYTSGISFTLNVFLSVILYNYIGALGIIYGTFISVTILHVLIMYKDKSLNRFLENIYRKPLLLFLYILVFLTYLVVEKL